MSWAISTDVLTVPRKRALEIVGVTFDWVSHVRLALGSDNWPATWAENGHQYLAWGDGWGFDGSDHSEVLKESLGYSRIEGGVASPTYRDTFGTPDAEAVSNVTGKSYAILAIGNTLYSFISPGSGDSNLTQATLYKSTDLGQSWSATSVQFTNASHGIGLPGFLQFGPGFTGTRDGYVYTYWTKLQGTTFGIQSPGKLYLSRVLVADIETQASWEFVTSMAGGVPTWGAVASAVSIFDDSNGVMIPSCCYNPDLRRYLLVSFHTTWNSGYLGIHRATEPWGPWTPIYYGGRWPAGLEVDQNTFYACFSPKWWSNGGVDFALFFTGTNANDSYNVVEGSFEVEG